MTLTMQPKSTAIVIPVKEGRQPRVTLDSLAMQSYQDFECIIQYDYQQNACAARNSGARKVSPESRYVLFCDDDIHWFPNGLEILVATLERNPSASFAYGSFHIDGRIVGDQAWDTNKIRQQNFVTTMSLWRNGEHPGWDESLKRLQDWDVVLTALAQHKHGVYCERLLFRTKRRADGITCGSINYEEAAQVVKTKHGIV